MGTSDDLASDGYAWDPDSQRWWVRPPMFEHGQWALDPTIWEVIEHDDGTVSVVPSIVVGAYHGWLTRGMWTPAV